MTKPTINIYSNFNFVSLGFVEHFLSQGFLVNIFAEDKNNWGFYLQAIKNNKDLNFYSKKDFEIVLDKKYILYTDSFSNNDNVFQKFIEFYKKEKVENSKILAVFPSELDGRPLVNMNSISDNVAVVYTTDLFSPRAEVSLSSFQTTLFIAANNKTFTYTVGSIYYPLFIGDMVKEISRWIFSFGYYGKETLITGKQISTAVLENKFSLLFPGLMSESVNGEAIGKIPKGVEVVTVTSDLNKFLPYFVSQKPVVKAKSKKTGKNDKRVTKSLTFIKWVGAIYLGIPLLVLLITLVMSIFSYLTFKRGSFEISKNTMILNKSIAGFGEVYSNILSKTPLIGGMYIESKSYFKTSSSISELYYYAVPIFANAKEIATKIVGDEIYDPDLYITNISSNLALVENSLDEYLKTINSNDYTKSIFISKVLNRFRLNEYLVTLQNSQKLLPATAEILGKNSKKTYLILFQNNMELRPTGGFIGSFGLVSFEGGRMADFSVSDVYSADGQLKGHVEPPLPIKNYLGEGSWYLRDSNWNPDFAVTARRVEWFLEKEIDRSVDGVIGVDLFVIKELLKTTGPIELPDYGITITSDNIYEKTQEEVHKEFFPGSTKKASFLTALSKNLITEIDRSAGNLEYMQTFAKALDKKHIQVFFNNENIQEAINNLNIGGGFYAADCGAGCFNDSMSVIEANLGVNKANYFITREFDINVNLSSKKLEREMAVTIKNSAQQELGSAATYKPYIRFVIDKDSQVDQVWSESGVSHEEITPEITIEGDKQEVGFFTSILNGESKTYKVKWSKDLSRPLSSYNLYIRKQAGTDDNSNVFINYASPLTQEGNYTYNTTLERDLLIKLPTK